MAERLKLLAPPTIRAFFGGGPCGHQRFGFAMALGTRVVSGGIDVVPLV